MFFHILTLFPEMIDQGLGTSILGRARSQGLLAVHAVNIRDFAKDRHRRVDDYTYGGGAGMLMQAQPVYDAWKSVAGDGRPRTVFVTPQGRQFDQKLARELAGERELVILCGHYEGIDERVLEEVVTDHVSIGDYVLTGGELAAMVMVDAIARLVPGVLHNDISAETESFHGKLLEYPQYSRPEVWHGRKVPSVLLGGDQRKIDAWRLEQSELRTSQRRPDLYQEYRKLQDCRERLMREKLLHMDMIQLIHRGQGELLYDEGGEILLRDMVSGIFFHARPEERQSAGAEEEASASSTGGSEPVGIEEESAASAFVGSEPIETEEELVATSSSGPKSSRTESESSESVFVGAEEDLSASSFVGSEPERTAEDPEQRQESGILRFLRVKLEETLAAGGHFGLVFHQKSALEELAPALGLVRTATCLQAVWTPREKMPVRGLYRPDGKPLLRRMKATAPVVVSGGAEPGAGAPPTEVSGGAEPGAGAPPTEVSGGAEPGSGAPPTGVSGGCGTGIRTFLAGSLGDGGETPPTGVSGGAEPGSAEKCEEQGQSRFPAALSGKPGTGAGTPHEESLRAKSRADLEGLVIRQLDVGDLEAVTSGADPYLSEDYYRDRLEKKQMFGAFFGNRLAGFIGVHPEGSVGMLTVFEKFRRKHVAMALETYAMNLQLEEGNTPFGQVICGNKASGELQRRLGLFLSKSPVYWTEYEKEG